MSSSLNFDKKDRELLKRINEVIDHGSLTSVEQEAFNTCLHPHGIQNMVNTHEVRMALAVINLLEKLNNIEGMHERLAALKSLHDEVVHSAQTLFRFNTARVLIQIMKDIVRSRDDEAEQLRLIHDFQKVAGGNPRIVRSFLLRYFLLEMPEQWNQKTMDDHVHDSNTMGRKNPTYLIMDARVKGIRRLSVVYYNYVEPHVAYELFEAARIMGISVRLAIKYKAKYGSRYAEILWSPRAFTDTQSVMDFLADPEIQAHMQRGKEVESWVRKRIINTLERFNSDHIKDFQARYGIKLPTIPAEEFIKFVGSGQTSVVRLAEFIHKSLMPHLEEKAAEIKASLQGAEPEKQNELKEELASLDELTADFIYQKWLHPDVNPEVWSLSAPREDDRPELLKLDIKELTTRLKALRANSRTTLITARLTAQDVLELLWEAKGEITHLEVFNIKEWKLGRYNHIQEINDLQAAINKQNVLEVKHIIRAMCNSTEALANPERRALFSKILENIPTLLSFYQNKPLGSRFGTDSTTSLGMHVGMGLAVPETLPKSAQKLIDKKNSLHSPTRLPLQVPVNCIEVYTHTESDKNLLNWIGRKIGLPTLGRTPNREWEAGYAHTKLAKRGNIITLGGETTKPTNGFVHSEQVSQEKQGSPFAYMNTTVLNILKVTIGFLPAFFTFMMTQSWWLLAWFGALIWFSITGIRNVIQAVIAGGGLQKGARINWKQLVNWSRVSDSLMYTGLSVVLLEGFTRNLLLGHWLGITVDKAPLLVFSIIALANGLYISSHNIFRGFPTTAVVGNLFRSVLAIPVAYTYNFFLAMAIPVLTGKPASLILVPAAAIVSKFASDTVAGIIESVADRQNNYRLRTNGIKMGAKALFDCFTKIELAFPKNDIVSLLSNPSEFINLVSSKSKALEIQMIVISLDLMYIWYYQPCAQHAFLTELKRMKPEQRLVFVKFQHSLSQYQEVSRLFLGGMLGQNFSKALAFYLDNYKNYLKALEGLCEKIDSKNEPAKAVLKVEESPKAAAELKAEAAAQ